MGEKELKWCQLAHYQRIASQGPHYSPHDKITFFKKMVFCGISDVAFTSVHSEKTHLKKLIMINIITKNLKKRQFVAGTRD